MPAPVPAPLPPNAPKTDWVEPVPLVKVPVSAPAQAPAAPTIEKNLPPHIDRILPERFNRFELVTTVGKELRLTVEASDPEGMPLRVSLLGVPEGAEFSEALRTLTWKPTDKQRGQHVLRFVAFDGEKEASRVMTVTVADNHAPTFTEEPRQLYAGDYGAISFAATDPEQDQLTYSLQGLPPGARFDADTGVLSWRPSESDAGEHTVRVTATDGQLRTERELTFRVEPRRSESDDWESYFLPGVGYSLYTPRDRDTFGAFRGPTLEILIAAWIHRNENRGPSHGRVYMNVELQESTEPDVSLLFNYALGFSLSLERNPRRNWLIPSYGADVGGMMQDEIGAHFQSTPFVALHLFSNQNVFINARAGYRIVPADMDRLGGFHAAATADFSVW